MVIDFELESSGQLAALMVPPHRSDRIAVANLRPDFLPVS
jgi:hypothetical protein